MAIVSNQSSASHIITLRKRVRRMLGDVDTNTARQRFADADIDIAIQDQLFRMYNELSLQPAEYTESTTLTYTGASTAFPTAIIAKPIIKIEDITDDADHPRTLQHVPYEAIEMPYAQGVGYSPMVWARMGNTLYVRPEPDASMTLQIWYLKNPLTPYSWGTSGGVPTGDLALNDSTNDQHGYPVQFEELICLGAAMRLSETDDETPPAWEPRYADLWMAFLRSTSMFRGRKRVVSTRKFS